MTTNFFAPPSLRDAPTVVRTQLASPAAALDTAPTWKGGWIVSGLAAVLAVAALGAVGGVASKVLADSPPAVAPVATSAPTLVKPAVTAAPALPPPATPEPSRIIRPTRTVVVPAPVAARNQEPVVLPPKPITPPAPPLGIRICDLVACVSTSPTRPAPPTTTESPGVPTPFGH